MQGLHDRGMYCDAVIDALHKQDLLCDQALAGLFSYLADPTRVAVRHPLTACCSVMLRRIDVEENLLFPRVARSRPDIRPVLDTLRANHEDLRTRIARLESLVISGQRDLARAAIVGLRERFSEHVAYEAEHFVAPLRACLGAPDEIRSLFELGYFRSSSPDEPGLALAPIG